MNFLRCNKCYEPLKATNPPFFLTQCGHLFCSKCISKDKKCSECKSTGVESLPLTQPLPDRVAPLFIPASELLDQFVFSYKFQNSAIKITMRRFEEMEKKYNGIKMAYWKLRKHFEELTKAHKNLQQTFSQYQTAQKISATQHAQGCVNIPRNYFSAAYCQPRDNHKNNINLPNHLTRVQPNMNERLGVRFNLVSSPGGYQTDDSMNLISNNHRMNHLDTPPMTPDVGLFRIPNGKNVPRSAGTLSGTSRTTSNSDNSTPLGRPNMF